MKDIDFTKEWWRKTLQDDVKLVRWLQKLQRTEISGYDEHVEFMKTHTLTERETLILTNIADDERTHSQLLIDMFHDRSIDVVPVGEDSTYWEQMLKDVDTFPEYCAANYFGEALAAFRFEVIHSMPETPNDIKSVIGRVLPDEIFHRETLHRLAGEEVLAKMKERHDDAYKKLTGR